LPILFYRIGKTFSIPTAEPAMRSVSTAIEGLANAKAAISIKDEGVEGRRSTRGRIALLQGQPPFLTHHDLI
jgi:hypothetical protein